jgi:FixJ family two-component response regulator
VNTCTGNPGTGLLARRKPERKKPHSTEVPGVRPVVYIVDADVESGLATSAILRSAGYDTAFFQCAAEFQQAHDPSVPGCVVLDCPASLHGLELQEFLRAQGRQRIFLTALPTVEFAVRALREGAMNVLTKPVSQPELLGAIREAVWVDALRRRESEHSKNMLRRFGSLTPREREVMARVLKGRLNKQTAAELGVVEKTIKVHRSRMMQKLGIRSVPELVAAASAVEARSSWRSPEGR